MYLIFVKGTTVLGADLYRSDYDEKTKDAQIAFEKAYKKRDAADTEEEKKRIQEQEVQPAYEALFQHPFYFRDSYNNSSLMWKLELSWWGGAPEYMGPSESEQSMPVPMEKWDYTMFPSGIRRLEQEVRSRSELLAKNVDELDDEDKRYFFDKFDKFLDFLKQAHEGNHTILCSC